MTGLAYILAAAPWGPVKIGTATDRSDMLRQVTGAPASVIECGDLDPARVAEAARQALPEANAMGWITATVTEASRRLTSAREDVSARVVADMLAEAAPMPPESRDGAEVLDTQPKPVKRRQRGGKMTNDDSRPALAPDVDPAVIRARLGLTQAVFAATFGLSVGTVRDWEQGKAAPDLAARALLAVIGHRPDVVREALASYG